LKQRLIIFGLMIVSAGLLGQKANSIGKVIESAIKISWVDSIGGDFSFSNNWSYPLGVEMKKDGRAGCADGGFCPRRCYSMLDSNGIVLKDSSKLFYQLLDTTHRLHSIQCEARCLEWAGTDIIVVYRIGADSVYCYTATGISTHCSLQLEIIKDICYATIDLNSIIPGGSKTYYCYDGYINIDKKLWKSGIMKAEFNLNFENKVTTGQPVYWKGKINAEIRE